MNRQLLLLVLQWIHLKGMELTEALGKWNRGLEVGWRGGGGGGGGDIVSLEKLTMGRDSEWVERGEEWKGADNVRGVEWQGDREKSGGVREQPTQEDVNGGYIYIDCGNDSFSHYLRHLGLPSTPTQKHLQNINRLHEQRCTVTELILNTVETLQLDLHFTVVRDVWFLFFFLWNQWRSSSMMSYGCSARVCPADVTRGTVHSLYNGWMYWKL